eukprot:4754844-Karenia_brevis.AAC.1
MVVTQGWAPGPQWAMGLVIPKCNLGSLFPDVIHGCDFRLDPGPSLGWALDLPPDFIMDVTLLIAFMGVA